MARSLTLVLKMQLIHLRERKQGTRPLSNRVMIFLFTVYKLNHKGNIKRSIMVFDSVLLFHVNIHAKRGIGNLRDGLTFGHVTLSPSSS
jgi:hypothetical protein